MTKFKKIGLSVLVGMVSASPAFAVDAAAAVTEIGSAAAAVAAVGAAVIAIGGTILGFRMVRRMIGA